MPEHFVRLHRHTSQNARARCLLQYLSGFIQQYMIIYVYVYIYRVINFFVRGMASFFTRGLRAHPKVRADKQSLEIKTEGLSQQVQEIQGRQDVKKLERHESCK